MSNIALDPVLGYVPVSMFVSGKNLRPIHVLDDIVNTQPSSWSWITYDYSGKPLQIAECILPLVNLLAPNNSNFGGPVAGTSAGWTGTVNCALYIQQPGLQTPLSSANSYLSAVGAPHFPVLNPQQQDFALELASAASGDMTANTTGGTLGVPVVAGQYYTASAYFLTSGNRRYCSVTINWSTAAGTACAHPSDTGTAVADASTYWMQGYVNAVAPATAAFAAITLKVAATGAASEGHYVALVSLALDNSLNNGMALPVLAYFEPGAGPGGMRNLITLGYDSATSQLVSVTPNNPLTYFGTGQTATYTATGMTDTQATWPMNGLVGQVISAPASIGNTNGAITTTGTVLFNTGTTIILTAAGWSNDQPDNASQYSIT
jgi:hypothetical protein